MPLVFFEMVSGRDCVPKFAVRKSVTCLNTALPTRRNAVLENSPLKSGPLFIPQNRRFLLTVLAAIVLVALVGSIVGVVYWHRSGEASAALADGMRTYGAPVVPAGQPAPAGTKTFSSNADRAREANAQFAAVANTYGMTPSGRNALYLQGVTALQMGQTATAETLLKKSAESWNGDIAALSKLSLAGLYHSTGRDADAITLLQKLADKPTVTVPKGLAQLTLADLYTSEGKKDQARKIYAAIKDKDPKSAAAEIASQDLGEAPGR